MEHLSKHLTAREEFRPGYAYKLAQNQYALDSVVSDRFSVDESRMCAYIPFASGERRDGVGDLLEIGGIETDRHRANPIVLFDHGKQVALPIATAEDPQTKAYTVELDPVSKTGGANCFFYSNKSVPFVYEVDGPKGTETFARKQYEHELFCEQVFDMMAKRFIRGGSIGYSIIDARELPPDFRTGTPAGLHLLRTKMLELSAVILPANQDTVSKSFESWCEGRRDAARRILSMPKICGKAPSEYLVKSLSGMAGMKKAQMGYEGKANYAEHGRGMEGDKVQVYEAPGGGRTQPTRDARRNAADYDSNNDAIHRQERQELDSELNRSQKAVRLPKEGEEVNHDDGSRHTAGRSYGRPRYDEPQTSVSTDTGNVLVPSRELKDDSGQSYGEQGKKGTGYSNPLSNSNVPPARFKPGVGAIKEIPLSDIRKKYRQVKSVRRRLKKSSPGASVMHVSRKDMDAFASDARSKGVQVKWMSEDAGTVKVKMTGDDSAMDALANAFGQPIGMSTKGIKAMPTDPNRSEVAGPGVPGDPMVKAGVNQYGEITTDTPRGNAKPPRTESGKEQVLTTASPRGKVTRTGKKNTDPPPSGEGNDGVVYDIGSSAVEVKSKSDSNDYDPAMEPYGAQILRRMHEDHGRLMADYDGMLGPLEHEGVRGHLTGVLGDLEKGMTAIEKLWNKNYKDLPALVNAEEAEEGGEELEDEQVEELSSPDDDMRGEEEEGETEEELREKGGKKKPSKDTPGKDMDTMDDRAVPADSGAELEEPDPEEAWAASQKSLRAKYRKTKGMCSGCGKSPCSCGKSLPGKRVKANYARQGVGEKVPAVEPAANDEEAADKREYRAENAREKQEWEQEYGKNPTNKSFDGSLLEHEWSPVNEATDFLGEIGQDNSVFDDEARMKSYHYHKTLDGISAYKAMSAYTPEGDRAPTRREANRAASGPGGGNPENMPGSMRRSRETSNVPPADDNIPQRARSWIDEDLGKSMDAPDGEAYHKAKNPPMPENWGGENNKQEGSEIAARSQGHRPGPGNRGGSVSPSYRGRNTYHEGERLPYGSQGPEETPDDAGDEKSLHPHRKMCKDASAFFKRLAGERAFGDPHRHEARQMHDLMRQTFGKGDGSQELAVHDAVEDNEELDEPGEMTRDSSGHDSSYGRAPQNVRDEIKKETDEDPLWRDVKSKSLGDVFTEQSRDIERLNKTLQQLASVLRR